MEDKIDPVTPIREIAGKKMTIIALVLLISVTITITIFPSVETYEETIPTVLTHVNGNEVYNQSIIIYDGNNPQSVTLEILNYTFNGTALQWWDENKSITFTKGKISDIAYYNYDDPIWYNISYVKQKGILGTRYAVLDVQQVKPVIKNSLNTNRTHGILTWQKIR